MSSEKKIYIETYGCQMNFADTEIILSIMQSTGYQQTESLHSADVVLINTCAIRDNAEQRIVGRIGDFYHYKKINPKVVVGLLGCMADRIKNKFIVADNCLDIIVCPDEYRKLPELIENAKRGEKGIAVKLSDVEKYEDIEPLRTEGISAWISIMRGCNNFCTYCVVPYARGRERSRSYKSILKDVEKISVQGFKEITLLGQNVNSYKDGDVDFPALLKAVADVDSKIRIRFMTSHPKDFSDELVEVIASKENICNSIHLPVQSGSDRILMLMNRKYTSSHYLTLIKKIKKSVDNVSLSTDIISGFPTETEDDHKMTLDLIREVEFDGAFTFKYSPRENTKAWQMLDDVDEEIKTSRLSEIIDLQREISFQKNKRLIGQRVKVLVEGVSKKSAKDLCGRTDTNKMVVLPKNGYSVGDYVDVCVEHVNSATLFGKLQKEIIPIIN